MDIRAATALVGQIDNVAEFCRRHQISRVTFYKWRRRFDAQGWDGLLQERSRRPVSSPARTDAALEDLIVATRLELLGQGLDHGPQSIVWTLQRREVGAVPSRATVARILSRFGLVEPQPRKRPKSATKRFTFSRPNECWQSDWTQWQLASGSPVAIAGAIDDHSRYLVGLQAAAGAATGDLVWSVTLAGITECGIPSMSLSDNGIVYTGRFHGYESTLEVNLRALGVRTINSAPFHPQTCGKIERFWQTLKKWLSTQRQPETVAELNELLDRFCNHYNHHRPHRALRGATPAEAFAATDKAALRRPAPAHTGLRHPRHRRRHVRQPVRRALQDQRRIALGRPRMRRHPRRRPHRHLQRHNPGPRTHRRPHPQLPARRQNHANLPHPRAQPHIMCKRCLET